MLFRSKFRNKRKMTGSSFDVHRTESSEEQIMATPSLDERRAESSQLHVRALNTQFASWVQTQLKNHPDELWEDGIRDYLAYASNIMEKFTDVVNWLKVNAAKVETSASAGSQISAENKKVPESPNSETNIFQRTTPLLFGATTNFTAPGSAGVFSNSQSSTGLFSNSHSSTGVFSTSKSSTGVSSNGKSSSGVHNSQSSPVFSPNQSSSIYSSSQSSGMFSASQSSGVFSNSQSSGTFPNCQTSNMFSNSQSSSMFSNSQSLGQLSNRQSAGASSNSQSPVLFSNSQSPGLFSNNQSFGGFSNTPSFGLFSSSQSSGALSNSQPSPLFGSLPQNHGASDEADADNDVEQPSSPSVKKSEEKGVVVVHEVKCKLYVKSSDPVGSWKEKGTGKLTIRCKEGVSKGTKDSKPTVIVRNDVGKLLLNALLYSGIKTNLQKNSLVAIFHTAGDGDGNDDNNQDSVVARTFLIRMKTEEDRNNLATAIQEYTPASESE
ncbi:nucleoporin NUP152 isoform X2 [Argentina anserina]|uniref:nucleoporin NUP152 isoform X2 n=1 Tax=Argentina anserina TaxID=57926 RepID=UPI0021767A7E|nr:nucleoporin NUP152 isoform X2 [Potentilla anserina]